MCMYVCVWQDIEIASATMLQYDFVKRKFEHEDTLLGRQYEYKQILYRVKRSTNQTSNQANKYTHPSNHPFVKPSMDSSNLKFSAKTFQRDWTFKHSLVALSQTHYCHLTRSLINSHAVKTSF